MNSTFRDIDDLIGKYLAGEATVEERSALEFWIRESASNKQYYDQFRIIFEKAAAIKDLPKFDTDAAWSRVKGQLKESRAARTSSLGRHLIIGSPWLRIAASILIVFGIGFFAYRFFGTGESATVEMSSAQQTLADTLPDGSAVTLNRRTQLAYSHSKDGREVSLTGEAYFTIQHDAAKTFVVRVGDLLIRDIGTSFNVRAYPEANAVEVLVDEGEVLFYTADNTGIRLKAGDKGVYDKSSGNFNIGKPEPNITAYKSKAFVFTDTDLASIVRDLNAVYDTRIVIGDSLARCRLTVSFNNEDILEIAGVIAETLGLTAATKNGTIVLEGTACEK